MKRYLLTENRSVLYGNTAEELISKVTPGCTLQGDLVEPKTLGYFDNLLEGLTALLHYESTINYGVRSYPDGYLVSVTEFILDVIEIPDDADSIHDARAVLIKSHYAPWDTRTLETLKALRTED